MRLADITGAALVAITLGLGVSAPAAELQQQQLTIAPPVNDAPKWYSVTAAGAGAGTGGLVLARSLTNGQPVGYVAPGYRFLAFGSDQNVITLALGGQVAYIPAATATEIYPTAPLAVEWKAYGPTLEERAELEKKKAKAAQARGLEPLSFKKAAEAKKMKELNPGGAAGLPMIGAGAGGDPAAGGAI